MRNIQGIVILVLLAVIFYLRECSPGSRVDCPDLIDSSTVIVPGDTVFTIDTVIPEPTEIIRYVAGETKWDTAYMGAEIDTSAIVADYLSKVYYADTLLNDSELFFLVEDTLQGNRLRSRMFTYQNKRSTAHITNVTYQNKPTVKVYGDLIVGGSLSTFDPMIGATIVNKKYNKYGIMFAPDITGKSNHRVYFKYGFLIRLKK